VLYSSQECRSSKIYIHPQWNQLSPILLHILLASIVSSETPVVIDVILAIIFYGVVQNMNNDVQSV
jgi:hypothetical protein